ncbi:MAG TPA: hypothetical protein VHU84_18940 [Lacipirellulaceae bacterium]|jgi:hypothetical protein|nr:hypothetical protein [Lacipirellulaceae bacterium]
MAPGEFTTTPTLRVVAAKPKFGIYYALLIIALCAMLVSCGVLYKFVRDFGGFGTVKGKVSMTEQRADFLCQAERGEKILPLASVSSVSSVAST